MKVSRRRITKSKTIEEKNKALVLEAFDTLFNQRDYVAAERYWSPKYIQHSAHIAPGREGLFNLIKSIPATLKYEPGTIMADGDFVIVHERFSGFGQPVNWIAADIVHVQLGWCERRHLNQIKFSLFMDKIGGIIEKLYGILQVSSYVEY